MDIMFALLEEVAGLTAFIEAHPELPFAHIAHRQAALATHELEMAIENATPTVSLISLNRLRTIAETKTTCTLYDAVESDNASLVWLMIESGTPVDIAAFSRACKCKQSEIVRILLNVIGLNSI